MSGPTAISVMPCRTRASWTRRSTTTEKALQLDPDYAWAHHNLANVLRVKHRLDEAYDHYQHVIRLDPKNSEVQNGLRSVLLRQGRGKEVQAGWRKLLDANPPEHEAWSGYAELCLFLGQQDGVPPRLPGLARSLRRDHLSPTSPNQSAGPACSYRARRTNCEKAVALTDRAVAAKAIDYRPGFTATFSSPRAWPSIVKADPPAQSP